MTQKFSNPQGSSSSENNNAPVKKITPALLFSAVFVAVSFIVMLIPLALFNVAQVAAMLGKRIALSLMLVVSLSFFLFGILFSSLSIISMGVIVLFAIPFFMSAIYLREKRKHWLYAASVLFLPVILFFGFLSFTPTKLTVIDGEVKTQIHQEIALKKEELQSQFAGRKPTVKEVQTLAQYDQFKEQIDQIVAVPAVRSFLDYNSWQRMAFLVFGAGSSFFLIGLLISFANVVFVDFGFEQIERLRAVVNYVRRHPTSFSAQLTSVLFAMPMVRANRLETPILINQHATQSLGNGNQKLSILASLWKPLKPNNTIMWQGFSFKFEGMSAWNLRNFSLPLPLVLLAVAFVGTMAFWYGNLESIISSLQHTAFAPIFALMSVMSFVVITILALQGMFTIYKRVSTFLVLSFVFLFFILGSKASFGPYAILAAFGAVGLLDYVYDWRGRKLKS
ncbi:hypothetical protein [Fluviispira multicolorata]|uniref:Uncharacterized protein n=1 Tax=Fluviispira multicolorata TaxID=2654512 RepID=A0A833JBW0_9BACT|nr:hypothetical protein [Fluviispira multicolorata]KAB8029906.1 hypothetical protein GCL57_10240 [Fluviispira multicolorata]